MPFAYSPNQNRFLIQTNLANCFSKFFKVKFGEVSLVEMALRVTVLALSLSVLRWVLSLFVRSNLFVLELFSHCHSLSVVREAGIVTIVGISAAPEKL
jgi:hypothetical protein